MSRQDKSELLERRTRELSALYEASKIAGSSLNLEEAVAAIFQKATQVIWAESGSLMLLDQERKVLTIKAACGLEEEVIQKTELKVGEGIAGWVAKFAEPLLLRDGVEDPRFMSIKKKDYINALIAPLTFKEEVLGVLCLNRSLTSEPFTEEDLTLLCLFANEAAIAIGNVQLHEEKERRLKDLSALFEIGQAITSTLNLKEILDLIMHFTAQLMGVQNCSLRLLDKEKKELILKASYGLGEAYIEKGPVKLGQSLVGEVVQEGKPIAAFDLLKNHRYEYPEYARREGIYSLLSVPLILKGEAIGALTIYAKSPHRYLQEEINRLYSLAQQAAIAIENARLYQELHEIYLSLVNTLVAAMEAKDPFTQGHSARASEYAVIIAEEMGLSSYQKEALRVAGLLHDVGKIGIPDTILLKPSQLTEEEWRIIKTHPDLSLNILPEISLPWDIKPIIYHHHERFDGGGYPAGLKGEEIPLGARILAAADCFDAMMANRPYREAFSREETLAQMESVAGHQLDPEIVRVLIQRIKTKGW